MAKPGTLVSSLGLVLFVVGWGIMTLALRENAFAAPVVGFSASLLGALLRGFVASVVRRGTANRGGT